MQNFDGYRLMLLVACGLLFSTCSSRGFDISIHLDVLTLNTFLLDTPDIIGGPSCESDCVERAEKICEVLEREFDSPPDLIFFQEVFEAEACTSLQSCLEDLGYWVFTPCLELDEDWENSCLIKSSKSSGLFMAAKTTMLDYTFRSFIACNGCLLQGSDCQANKGFQYAKIQSVGGCGIHVINTHLDAGDNADDRSARAAQVVQISNFVDSLEVGTEELVIYGGDFNTKSLAEIVEVELRLGATTVNKDEATVDSGFVLDHIMYAGAGVLSDETHMVSQTCDSMCVPWFDSDHFGLRSSFTYTQHCE